MDETTAPPTGSTTPPPPQATRPGHSTLILVLGVIGVVCCNVLGPVAWIMGHNELKAVRRGEVSSSSEGTVKAGMILGIVGTVFLAFGMFWLFLWGGLAMLAGYMDALT